jgi:hypothetical protein
MPLEFDISVTQAWFVTMTGFCSRGGVPLVREEHLNRPEYRDEIKATPTEYILDKSKADITVKGVAIAKVIIFLVKYTARVAAGLAITPLEATTLAYTIIGLALWAIWWNKPFEVQIAIPVGPSDASEEDTGAFYAETYLDRLLSGADLLSQPSSTSVPSSWSFGPRDRDPTFNFTVVLNTVVGTGFGLLHLVCPNVVFASPTETALWYTAGALVAGLPILVFGPTLRKLDGTEGDWVSTAVKTRILVAVRTIAVVLYMVGRALLLALPLIALRSVPPAALTDIDSLSYL